MVHSCTFHQVPLTASQCVKMTWTGKVQLAMTSPMYLSSASAFVLCFRGRIWMQKQSDLFVNDLRTTHDVTSARNSSFKVPSSGFVKA